MKKINKKGFTLVELLAVIVILGILLLIAVPSVNNIIKNSRKKAFLSQVKLAVENVETTASVEKDSITSACNIEITTIELERGSWDGITGGIQVKMSGNKVEVKPYISDTKNSFSVTGVTSIDTAYKLYNTSDFTVNSCTWYK